MAKLGFTEEIVQPKYRFKLTRFNDVMLSTTASYLIKDIILADCFVILWGSPKSGKSFLGFDMAMHVALGREYRGHRVRQGSVVYCALEGGQGFRKRIVAWRMCRLYEHAGHVPFYLIDVSMDLIAEADVLVGDIKAQLNKGEKPALVVIDTANRALSGRDENSSDMGKLVKAADVVRAAFGCTVLLIHHCGVSADRPRGHSSLPAAADASVSGARDKADNVVATTHEVKDGASGTIITSRLRVIELGLDDEGEIITSCVIEPVEAESEGEALAKIKLSDKVKAVFDALIKAVKECGEKPPISKQVPHEPDIQVCPVEVWRDYYYQASIDKPDTRQKAFVRGVEKLKSLGFVGIWCDYAWQAGQAGQGQTESSMSGDIYPDRYAPPPLGGAEMSGVRVGQESGQSVRASGQPSTPSPALRKINKTPEAAGTCCIYCNESKGEVWRMKDASAVGSKSEPLHEECAAPFFRFERGH
jgi:hypothetical protein